MAVRHFTTQWKQRILSSSTSSWRMAVTSTLPHFQVYYACGIVYNNSPSIPYSFCSHFTWWPPSLLSSYMYSSVLNITPPFLPKPPLFLPKPSSLPPKAPSLPPQNSPLPLYMPCCLPAMWVSFQGTGGHSVTSLSAPPSSPTTGNTPLHIAAGRRLKEIVALLMAYGANPALANGEGDFPTDLPASLLVRFLSCVASTMTHVLMFVRRLCCFLPHRCREPE